jgi:hypothetical protein
MPELNASDLAARYGWSMAILNSNSELKALFNKAVAGTWTPEKFTAELRNTKWFKKNGENARQTQLLKTTDPETYRQRVSGSYHTVVAAAVEMGAVLNPSLAWQIAENSLSFGWNDQQVRSVLGSYVKQRGGQYYGVAQQYETELREYARQMGVRVSDSQIGSWVKAAAGGKASVQTFLGTIQNLAESAFPQFKERFQSGETLDDIAAPYKQTMSNLLELNPEAVDNFDPTVRAALSAKDAKTGKPALKTLWEFENDLRKDKRWLRTSNAQDAASNTVNRVLQDWGLIT